MSTGDMLSTATVAAYPLLGSTIAGRYRLVRSIVSETACKVFLAEDESTASPVVATLVPAQLAQDPKIVTPLRQQLRRTAALAQQCRTISAVYECELAAD